MHLLPEKYHESISNSKWRQNLKWPRLQTMQADVINYVFRQLDTSGE